MTFRRSIMIVVVVVEMATVVVRSQDMTANGHHFLNSSLQTATRSVGEGLTVSILQ